MKRYIVTGAVVGIGTRKHFIRAESQDAAWERFKRAYPDRECIFVWAARTLAEDAA